MILIPILLASAPVAEKNTPVIPASMPLVYVDSHEDGGWTGSLNFGASTTDGTNTDNTSASLVFDATKKVENDRYSAGFTWNYAEQEGELSQRRTYARGQYDRFLDEKSFVYGQISGESDEPSQLDMRSIIGVGYGYQFRDDDKWKVSGEIGLSYLDEEFDIAPATPPAITADDEASYLSARLAYKWEWFCSERYTFAQTAQIYPALQSDGDVDTGDLYGKLETSANAQLNSDLIASLRWILDYDETPATDDFGRELDEDDNLFLLTVGWKF